LIGASSGSEEQREAIGIVKALDDNLMIPTAMNKTANDMLS